MWRVYNGVYMLIFECLPNWSVLMILRYRVQKRWNIIFFFLKPGTFARNGAVEVIKTVTREISETFWNSIFLAQPCRNTTSIRDIVPQLCAAPAISWKLTLIDHTLSGSSVLVGWILDKDLKVSLIQNSAKQEVDLHIFAVDFFFCVSLRHGDMLQGVSPPFCHWCFCESQALCHFGESLFQWAPAGLVRSSLRNKVPWRRTARQMTWKSKLRTKGSWRILNKGAFSHICSIQFRNFNNCNFKSFEF